MAKGDKSRKMRQRDAWRKAKERKKKRLAGGKLSLMRLRMDGKDGSEKPRIAEPKPEKVFVSLDLIPKMPPTAKEHLRMNGFHEAYYDPVRGDFVARRKGVTIRGGKLAPDDWYVVFRD
jgi:hypothetical protein